MKCTSCSTEIRPVVAVDIDGTLGQFHFHLIRFAEDYLNYWGQYSPYDGLQDWHEWFCEQFDVDYRTFQDIKLAFRQGAQKRSMAIYPYAPRLVHGLRRLGAETWLTTTRPYLRLDNIDPDTRAWLNRHEIEFDGLLYDEEKYLRLSERVHPERVVAVLDDLGEQYDQAAHLFGKTVPILRRNEYNAAVLKPNVVVTLEQAYDVIGERILTWKEQHA